MTTSRIAELVAIAVSIGGCLVWVGATANDVQSNKVEIARVKEKTEATPVNVAVLQTQVGALQTTVGEIKAEQGKQADKLDKILEKVSK